MTYKHIESALEQLKKKHRIFHSEADFQFSLAWELQKILPTAKIRLEYCPSFAREMHIDIYVIDEDGSHPIELKYKSRGIEMIDENEYFKLKNHGAQDIGRYDYLYDIQRIENMKKLDKNFKSGYAIILTNDSAYWKAPANNNTVDSAFRIHEGRIIEGSLSWTTNAGKGTTKDREDPIVLDNRYKIEWSNFSNFEGKSYGTFKLCAIEIL